MEGRKLLALLQAAALLVGALPAQALAATRAVVRPALGPVVLRSAGVAALAAGAGRANALRPVLGATLRLTPAPLGAPAVLRSPQRAAPISAVAWGSAPPAELTPIGPMSRVYGRGTCAQVMTNAPGPAPLLPQGADEE